MARCDRCHEETNNYDSNGADDLRLLEVQMSFGLLAYLCFACRRDWVRLSAQHHLFREYSQHGFRLRCWQVRWRRRPGTDADMAGGLALLAALEEMEPKLLKLAQDWVRAGPSRAEREEDEE